MKERDEKIARGEKVGRAEKDPTEEVEVGMMGILKFLLYLAIFIVLTGKFFTGSFLWEYEGKWVQLKTYMPVSILKYTLDVINLDATFSRINACSLNGYWPNMTALTRTNPSTLPYVRCD